MIVMGIGPTLATLAWRGITRPMVDTVGYRATVISLENGWECANDRVTHGAGRVGGGRAPVAHRRAPIKC